MYIYIKIYELLMTYLREVNDRLITKSPKNVLSRDNAANSADINT